MKWLQEISSRDCLLIRKFDDAIVIKGVLVRECREICWFLRGMKKSERSDSCPVGRVTRMSTVTEMRLPLEVSISISSCEHWKQETDTWKGPKNLNEGLSSSRIRKCVLSLPKRAYKNQVARFPSFLDLHSESFVSTALFVLSILVPTRSNSLKSFTVTNAFWMHLITSLLCSE